MSEMQLFVQMAQQHSQEREHRKFVERAETEGWDWRTTLTEAAKRGISDNKDVMSYLDQKRSLEEMQKAEKGRVGGMQSRFGTSPVETSQGQSTGSLYADDPITQGANELALSKQQTETARAAKMQAQPGVSFDAGEPGVPGTWK